MEDVNSGELRFIVDRDKNTVIGGCVKFDFGHRPMCATADGRLGAIHADARGGRTTALNNVLKQRDPGTRLELVQQLFYQSLLVNVAVVGGRGRQIVCVLRTSTQQHQDHDTTKVAELMRRCLIAIDQTPLDDAAGTNVAEMIKNQPGVGSHDGRHWFLANVAQQPYFVCHPRTPGVYLFAVGDEDNLTPAVARRLERFDKVGTDRSFVAVERGEAISQKLVDLTQPVIRLALLWSQIGQGIRKIVVMDRGNDETNFRRFVDRASQVVTADLRDELDIVRGEMPGAYDGFGG